MSVWVSFLSFGCYYTSEPTFMCKIGFTNERLFMSLVGPRGSGKTRLLFAMFASPTVFYPKLPKAYHIYKEYQLFFKEMAAKLNTDIVLYLDSEMIKMLENCVLVFDDSCEEVYHEKEIVMIAVAGRPKKIHCVFVRDILFNQSKWSRRIDLNTSYVLFLCLRATLSKLISLVDNQINRSSFEVVVKNLRLQVVIF